MSAFLTKWSSIEQWSEQKARYEWQMQKYTRKAAWSSTDEIEADLLGEKINYCQSMIDWCTFRDKGGDRSTWKVSLAPKSNPILGTLPVDDLF
jgi:hypothetical protein